MQRGERMAHHGVLTCPDWCTQDEEENEYEAHLGPFHSYVASSGDTFYVRSVAGWSSLHQGTNDLREVQLILIPCEASPRLSDDERERYGIELADGTRTVLATGEWHGLNAIIAQAEMDLANWLDHGDEPVCGIQWAYVGAEYDWRQAQARGDVG